MFLHVCMCGYVIASADGMYMNVHIQMALWNTIYFVGSPGDLWSFYINYITLTVLHYWENVWYINYKEDAHFFSSQALIDMLILSTILTINGEKTF